MKLQNLKWSDKKPEAPGKYYTTNKINPLSRKDIIEINIYNRSSLNSELGTLIAPLSKGIIIFYSDYKYFSGPYEI